jgi:hypothetical protein
VPVFPAMAVAKDMLQARAFLSTWQKPVLLMFSNRDPITKGMNKDFAKLIPTVRAQNFERFLATTFAPLRIL